MKHEEYKEMLELEALDALEEADSRALHAHLATCAECRAELAELREAAAMLFHLDAGVKPSAELRARILESVRSPAQSARRESSEAGADEAEQPPPNVLPPSARHGAQVFTIKKSAFVSGALVALIFVAALIVALVILWKRHNEMRAELTRVSQRDSELSRRSDELQAEVNDLSERNRELESEAIRLKAQGNQQPEDRTGRQEVVVPPAPGNKIPDERAFTLTGTDKAPGASARLVYDRRQGIVTFTAYNLPPAPAGKAYQLWFMVDGHAVYGGVFKTSPAGYAMLRRQVSAEARDASAFVVTLEQATGASTPTGPKYLASSPS